MTEARSRHPILLYPDTATLSNLIKGGGREGAEVGRLLRLIATGRVRLCVSFVHLLEMSVDEEVVSGAKVFLDVADLHAFVVSPNHIFQSELSGIHPRATPFLVPVSWSSLAMLKVERFGVRISRRTLTRSWKVIRWLAFQAALASWESPRSSKADRKRTISILDGHWGSLPWVVRFAKPLFARLLDHGKTRDRVIKLVKLNHHGLGWTAAYEDSSLKSGSRENASAMPAVALRRAVQTRIWKHADGRRPSRGDIADELHMAYVACCDVATVDDANWDATKEIAREFDAPRLFRNSAFSELLDWVEARG